MKLKSFILLVFLLLAWQFSQAQYCSGSQPGSSSTFDWMADSWTVRIKPNQTQAEVSVVVPSPYHPNTIASQPNTQHIETASGQGDYLPEDGWMLVIEEMGLDVSVRFPQFVIYNRYEAKLRYFAYLTDITGIDEVQVEASFSTGNNITHVSAALEHIYTPMNVVENYEDKQITISVPNEFFSQSGIWVMADIPIAYDPCTCQYASMIRLGTSSVDYTTIDFTLEGGGVITQVIDNGTVVNQGNKFANVLGKVPGGVSKGNSAFKSGTSLVSSVNKLLVERANNRLTQEIRNDLIAGGFSGNDLTESDVNTLWNLYQAGNVNPPLLSAINGLFPKKVSSVVPDWLKNSVPFASSAFAILDFLIGGGKSTAPKPMQFQANFQFTGTGNIDDSDPQASIDFNIPGSMSVVNSPGVRKPLYNEVMGILNLMEVPILYRSSYQTSEWIDAHYEQFYYNVHEYSLKLANPLRYALNPASGLDLVDIRASLQFRNCFLNSDFFDPNPQVPDGLTVADDGIWETPYMPLSCLEDYSIFFRISQENSNNPILLDEEQCQEVYLHLTAKLKPHNNPNADEVGFAALYNVSAQTAPYTYTETPANPYIHIPEDVSVDNIEDVINGNIQSWNEITITQDIRVTEQINDFLNDKEPREVITVPANPITGTAAYNYLADARGRAIGSIIHAPFVISNTPNCGTNNPVNSDWLQSFCSDPLRYNPVLSAASQETGLRDLINLKSEIRSESKLSPNPASGWSWLDYELIEDNYISIQLADYTGRRLLLIKNEEWQQSGKYRQVISTNQLVPGLYYVSIIGKQGVETLKLLKE